MAKKIKAKPPIKKKYIESPEKLWELFKSYEKKTKENPFREHDFVGKDGDSVHREKERCLTMEGFELYLFDQDIISDLKDYFSNKEQRYTSYAPTCSRVRLAIRRDQIEGGMAGIYNPSITQRLNGLVEKSHTTIAETPLFPDVPADPGD